MQNLNVPNVLTVLRILCLIPMFIVGLNSPFQGALLAAFLGITDFADGYIARRFNQSTKLGRILDPISDRLLLITSFVLFLIMEVVPLWYMIVIGLREILVSIGTIIIWAKKLPRPNVNYLGKVSAFATMVATPSWVVVYTHHGIPENLFLFVAIISSMISIPTGYVSLYEYISIFKPKKLKSSN